MAIPMRSVSLMDDVNSRPDPAQDIDDATDQMLFRDNATWSKGRLKRAKFASRITGHRQPSRRKVLSEIRSSEDVCVWNLDVHGMSIRCAKVYNPVVLTRPGTTTWSQLSGVQRLEIEDPEATQNSVPKQLVSELRHLESLSITWTKIRSLPSSLFHLPLHSLYLQRNQIKSLSGIERATQLTILDISNNELDSLPKTFGQLRSLITLNLSGNRLHELPDSVGSLTQLKSLDCSCNRLRALPQSLCNVYELTSLDVSSNQLTSLPEAIGCLPNLDDLRVRSNQLTSLPESFRQLLRLSSLQLRGNKFEEVPPQLSSLTNLQSLNMRDNLIRHMDEPITSLRYLILEQNELTQIDVGILQCRSLQLLSLKHNKLVEVTGGVSKLANVRSLNFSDNAITEIPAEISRLAQLRNLSLCATRINTIPLAVARMPSLKTLELEDCRELDGYLNIAYKSGGLAGIVEYLQKEQEAGYVEFKPSEVETTANTESAGAVLRPSRRIVDRTVSDNDSNRATLMPEDDSVAQSPTRLRNVAGLSIIPGTSVQPPAQEAMLQARGNHVELVHVARQSLCPPAIAPKPSYQKRSQAVPVAAKRQSLVDAQTPPAATLETVHESPGCGIVQTMPQFGDLTSASTTDNARLSGLQSNSGSRSGQDDGEEKDPAQLYATVMKKHDVEQPLAVETAKPPSKPRPPTKKKPSVRL